MSSNAEPDIGPETITKESTWGTTDDTWEANLKSYEGRRCSTPWARMSLDAPAYHRQRESITQTIFNPVIQRHRDQNGNYETLDQVERTLTRPVSEMNKSYDDHLKHEAPYNIITGESKLANHPADPLVDNDAQKPYKPQDTRYLYNIVTGLDHAETAPVAPELRPPPSEKPVIITREHPTKVAQEHDFDIVTNRYTVDHEKRIADEDAGRLASAMDTLAQTKVFDVVTGDFVGPRGEEMRQKERETVVRREQQHERDLPPYIKRSDGRAFDISTTQVKDPELTKKIARNDTRTGRRVLTENLEATVAQADERARTSHTRRDGRVDPATWHEPLSRGFRIVTNEPHYGVGGRAPAFPKARPRLNAFDVLEAEAEPARLFETVRGRIGRGVVKRDLMR